jgi:hypothetical protein
MIRLETSKRTGITNFQLVDVSAFERNWAAEIPKLYPRVRQRTKMSPTYNCHGLTFASHRTRITESEAIETILVDDKWTAIEMQNALPGDIVVYFSEEGDPNHSGIIVACDDLLGVPTICSKWGSAGEYVHLVTDCPPFYGPIKKCYRCTL